MMAEHSGIISLSISEPIWRAWDSEAPGMGVTVVPSLSPSIAEVRVVPAGPQHWTGSARPFHSLMISTVSALAALPGNPAHRARAGP